MASKVWLGLLGLAGLGALLLRGTTGKGGAALRGGFSIATYEDGIPEAVAFSGLSRPSATITFKGSVKSTGNSVFRGGLTLLVLSGTTIIKAATTGAFSVPAGAEQAVELNAQVLESDPPGSITARVELVNVDSGAIIAAPASGVLATIESQPGASLSGSFGIS